MVLLPEEVTRAFDNPTSHCQCFTVVTVWLLALCTSASTTGAAPSQPLGHPLRLDSWKLLWGQGPETPPRQPAQLTSSDAGWISLAPDTPPLFDNPGKDMWLRTRLPEVPWRDPALKTGKMWIDFDVYLDSQLIYQHRSRGGRASGQFTAFSHLIPLPAQASGRYLTLHIRSQMPRIGHRGPIWLGSEASFLAAAMRDDFDNLLVGAFALLMGAFAFFVALRYRELESAAAFALFSVAMGTHIIARTDVVPHVLGTANTWGDVAFLALMVVPPSGARFLLGIVRAETHWRRPVQLLHRIVFAVAVVLPAYYYASLFLDLPPSGHAYLLTLFRWSTQLLVAVGSVALAVLARRGDTEARLALGGVVLILAAGVYNTLVLESRSASGEMLTHLGLLALLIALAAILATRMRRIHLQVLASKRELEELMRERQLMVRDLHDGVSGMVTNIAMLGETAMQENHDGASGSVAHIADLARACLGELRQFMGTFTDRELSGHELAAELRQFGLAMCTPRAIDFSMRVSLPDEAPPLRALVYLNVLKIYQEALANALKHAGASHISVAFELGDLDWHLCIEDDGQGLVSTPTARKGRGLPNMQARAEMLGGSMEIEERVDNHGGARLLFKVPHTAQPS